MKAAVPLEAAVLMMRFGRRPPVLLAVCLGLVALAGCATASSTPSAPVTAGHSASAAASSPSPSPPPVNVAAFNALARQEASAWARSPLAKTWRTGLVVLLPSSLSAGPSGGFPSGQDKAAFINGDLVFTGPQPSGTPVGRVTWPDGSSMRVPVLSEAQAFGELTSSRQCPGCATTPLAVTAARPATLAVATSRGTAQVPAWAFTLKGVSAPVFVAALPPGSYATLGGEGLTSAKELAPLGKDFTGAVTATASAGGRALTVQVYGSPCDKTWGGLAYAVGGTVVVGGWMHNPNPDQPCAAVGITRPATIRLAAPVGDRVIINALTGQPFVPDS